MSDTPCTHPPTRLFAWTAFDNSLVIACCECGEVLQGGIGPEGPLCIAYTRRGVLCNQPAQYIDRQRGGMVCETHRPEDLP